ncbi:hypothetical protein [Denitrobaculum tricleocarpae]|uniref:DUF3592 domain-containing protein n=1 Tax=Denitrobaculum tricleocarpae TaxID=2591009 RepID=A0A545TUC3_9PROT|nr:hypothetical protein [Denitrobaculum tricleocarpae]TQV80817.1 hypothetical protein FKG95_11755 [Denitrobaculum tricleocarpae]
MAVNFAAQPRAKRHLDRRAAAIVFLLAAGAFGYWYLHYTDISDAFAEESLSARGEIVAVSDRSCSLTDYCIDDQKRVQLATVVFRDNAGRLQRAVAEFRSLGHSIGDEVDIRYLAKNPAAVIAGNSEFAQDVWTIFRVQLAIGLIITILFSIGFWLPKGMLTKY